MDVPDGIIELLFSVLAGIGCDVLQVIVDGARDHVEVKALGRFRLLVHEQRQALGTGVRQPFLDGQAIALRLGDLLSLVVEKQLIVEAFRWRAAKRLADP